MSAKTDDRCVLCLEDKRSPVTVQCGHSFCAVCLSLHKSYEKYAWARKCPICRSQLKEKRRAVKRKFNETNANTNNPNPVSQTSTAAAAATSSQNPESSLAETTETARILEVFMALASFDSEEYRTAEESTAEAEDDDLEYVEVSHYNLNEANDDESDYNNSDDSDDYNELDYSTDTDDEIYYIFSSDDSTTVNLTSADSHDFGENSSSTNNDNNGSDTALELANESVVPAGNISNTSGSNTSSASSYGLNSDVSVSDDINIVD